MSLVWYLAAMCAPIGLVGYVAGGDVGHMLMGLSVAGALFGVLRYAESG